MQLKKLHFTLSIIFISTCIATALITSTSGFIALYQMKKVENNVENLANISLPQLSNASEININLIKFRKSEIEFIAQPTKKNDDLLNEYSSNIYIYGKTLSNVIISDQMQAQLDKFNQEWSKYQEQHEKLMSLIKSGKIIDAQKFSNEVLTTQFVQIVDNFKKLSELSFNDSILTKDASLKITNDSTKFIFLATALSLIISVLLSWIVAKRINYKINTIATKLIEGSKALNSSTMELSESSTKLSESVTEQVSAIHETSTSLTEISGIINQNNGTTDRTKNASNQSINAADTGIKNMESLQKSIETIAVNIENLLIQISQSHEDFNSVVSIISSISDKTKIINDIVFQTRLLSFNASVEAARAGEHGRGFAVVAEEIGKLAQISGTSANEISKLLESSVNKVNEIVHKAKSETDGLVTTNKIEISQSKKAAELCFISLQNIITNISSVNELVESIYLSSNEQIIGVREISTAINQLNESTNFNSNIAQLTSIEAKKLDDQARNFNYLVEELKQIIQQ